MHITILGAGNIGLAAGKKWKDKGHSITFGVRDPESQKAWDARNIGAEVKPFQEAMQGAEVVLIAVPFGVTDEVIKNIQFDWDNVIIIDTTNPISASTEPFDSAAEAIAAWTGNGNVVKAFNTTGVGNMLNPIYNGTAIETFICGDDADAKKCVAGLAEDLGFRVMDMGGLQNAVLLENLAKMWVTAAYKLGKGPNFAFTVVQR
ncbi:MAG TPA: NAD(P)-binding domain-containing protein [Chitinophagales bacterium]|nr:NAD(P)-binding domain-containing protein [Chitinophagales bacterium]HMZ88341.1 NAD(P)-binding domain-containing protein [Chitinophagales bacterium]HNJ87913.1 NAD(P)-binding domain-containing protein [Chitinophagales bacterium]HNM28502.1 NAD(P)-binding domain-containing protein [Chitinophagales bacterium]